MVEQAGARKAFVTGGSGFVGGRLIKALIAQGWEVRALARGEKAVLKIKALGAVPVVGELTDLAVLSGAMTGCQVVFHAAALFKMWGSRKEFDDVNVNGTRAIVETAIGTASVRKVVMVSAGAVVQGDPKPLVNIDEHTPVQEPKFAPYSASKAEAEKILLSSDGQRAGFQTIALRPPMIWGAGMPMLDQMVDVVQSGSWQWPDGGTQTISTCHIDNLVGALLLAVDRGHGAYFVADAEQGMLKSVIGDLLATRGVKVGDKSVPFGVAWMLAGAMGFFWKLLWLKGEPPITRQMLGLIGKPFTLNIKKAERELGYAPHVTWKQGIAEMRPDA
jgi:nucleoside-diphosphate-sugar epimerase